jgi:hypothetical protein
MSADDRLRAVRRAGNRQLTVEAEAEQWTAAAPLARATS